MGQSGSGRLEVLSESERQQVIEEWNETRAEVNVQSVAAQFEAQVARTPEAVALVSAAGDVDVWGAERARKPGGALSAQSGSGRGESRRIVSGAER